MTHDEAIKWLSDELMFLERPNVNKGSGLEKKIAVCRMAIDAIREQEERRWIPVTERIADDGEQVIVVATGKPESNITLDNAIEFAEFSTDEGWILEMWPEWEDPKVTYWMPCPEPPKEVM